jgi:5-formyltetrahydrofolate cyclo-ligase
MTERSSVAEGKRALRLALRAILTRLPPAAFALAGERGARALVPFLQPRAVPGAAVAFFASLPLEIDTAPLDAWLRTQQIARVLPAPAPKEAGATLIFRAIPPDVAVDALPLGPLSIRTPPASLPPVALATCAAVVVPGLAFDETGGRLGYGRGYYDKALAGVDLERCVGLCLDEQIVAWVPTEDHDVRLRWLCTPARGVFRTRM